MRQLSAVDAVKSQLVLPLNTVGVGFKECICGCENQDVREPQHEYFLDLP